MIKELNALSRYSTIFDNNQHQPNHLNQSDFESQFSEDHATIRQQIRNHVQSLTTEESIREYFSSINFDLHVHSSSIDKFHERNVNSEIAVYRINDCVYKEYNKYFNSAWNPCSCYLVHVL